MAAMTFSINAKICPLIRRDFCSTLKPTPKQYGAYRLRNCNGQLILLGHRPRIRLMATVRQLYQIINIEFGAEIVANIRDLQAEVVMPPHARRQPRGRRNSFEYWTSLSALS